MIAICLFAYGVPLLFWALLYYQRHNLMHKDAQYLGFFFSDYKAQYWYWEVRALTVCSARVLALLTTIGLCLPPANLPPRLFFR